MKRGIKITIILLIVILVLGFIITRTIFSNATKSIDDLDSEKKKEIENSFVKENKNLVISNNVAEVKQGTENFGIVIGFFTDDSSAWGERNVGCKYSIIASDSKDYCTGVGWTTPEKDILTGTKEIPFDEFNGERGYSLIRINIPKKIPPCLQKFEITVNCEGYPNETTTEYFYIEVVKKGLF
jgi:hypothetical protein